MENKLNREIRSIYNEIVFLLISLTCTVLIILGVLPNFINNGIAELVLLFTCILGITFELIELKKIKKEIKKCHSKKK